MRALAFVLMLFATQTDPRIAEGISAHDAGRYDEAIAAYKAVLTDDPDNVTARYELAYSYSAKGDTAQCIATLQPVASSPSRVQPRVLEVLGNCYDMAGQSAEAIASYRKGLALAPDDASITYNLGVALYGAEKFDEARALLKKNATLRPAHPNGLYYLGRVFEQQNFRTPALYTFLRFLAVEPDTARSKEVAERVLEHLHRGVTVSEDAKNVNVTIDDHPRTEEGNFGSYEMMLGMVSAARYADEEKPRTEFERTLTEITTAVTMLMETRADLGTNFTTTQHVPFFKKLVDDKLLDAFAAVALSSLDIDGRDAWMKQHGAEVERYRAFAMQTR